MQFFPDLASPDRKVLAWLADKAISVEAKEELRSMAKDADWKHGVGWQLWQLCAPIAKIAKLVCKLMI